MILVDSNVLLDIVSTATTWRAWSGSTLARLLDTTSAVINPIIYAEVSARYRTPAELDQYFPPDIYAREDLPWEAAFVAGKAFVLYRQRGGNKTSPLPDFYIGAHAAVRGYTILTRDPRRYRTYFPRVQLIAPTAA